MSVLFNFSLTFSGYEHRRHTALQHNVIKAEGKKNSERDPEKQSLLDGTDDGTRVEGVAGTSTANGTVRGGGGDEDVVLRRPKKNFFKSPLLYQNALL